jgi:predicted amidohydrolase
MADITFSIIQTKLHWENKEANLRTLEEKIRGIEVPTQVVVLPEMFSTGFSMNAIQLAETMTGPTVEWMRLLSAERKIIITGSLIIEEKGFYYNRLIWMFPNGQLGVYDKKHLFGYAEEDRYYSSGKQRFIPSVNGWKLNGMVCYDLRFPVWSRQSPSASKGGEFEYDVLLYVANWPKKRNTAWKSLLQARAIENQCYVIGVNRIGEDGKGFEYSGDSAVIDPLGEFLYHKENEEDVFTITLSKKHLTNVREKLPFLKDADPFVLISENDPV